MKKSYSIKSIFLFIILFSFGSQTWGQAFSHPGILNSQIELQFIKAQIEEGKQPWLNAYLSLQNSSYSSLNYKPEPFAKVECGSYNKPNIGCNQFVEDGIASYCHALLFYLTDDIRYANKAIEIINAWSYKYVENTNSNARLEVSWATPWYVNGAELLKYSNSGWKDEDIAQFNSMLDRFLPYVLDETMPGNNWIQSAIEAHMAIAVFKDNRVLFNQAIDRWKFRTTTYIYQKSDGNTPINTPGKTDGQMASIWRSSAASTSYIDGSAMETCRDLGHLKMGFASMMYAAEIAWQQGVDLFIIEQKRLTDFMELHGSWMTGEVAVPSYICEGTVKARLADSQGIKPPKGGGQTAWEIAYNHLHKRLFVPLPYTKKMLDTQRPANISKWVSKMETLTHAEREFSSPDLSVEITNPNVELFTINSEFKLSVEANINISNNNFSHAILYLNNDSIRRIDEAPYIWGDSVYKNELTNLDPGKYVINVVAVDKDGKSSSSGFVLEVLAPKGPFSGSPITIPGTIEAENFNKGGEGAAYHDHESINVGGAYRDEGVDIELTSSGQYVVSNIYPKEWLEYTVDIVEEGYYNFSFNYASRRSGGKIGVEISGSDEPLITGLMVPLTLSWNDYRTITKEAVLLPKGTYNLRINFEREGFNLNKIDISSNNGDAIITPINDPTFLYPNPTKGIVLFSRPSTWELKSLSGKTLRSGKGTQISLLNEAKGIYFITTEGITHRIIKL